MKNKTTLVLFSVLSLGSLYCVYCANTFAERQGTKEDPVFFMLAAIWLVLIGLFAVTSGVTREKLSEKPRGEHKTELG